MVLDTTTSSSTAPVLVSPTVLPGPLIALPVCMMTKTGLFITQLSLLQTGKYWIVSCKTPSTASIIRWAAWYWLMKRRAPKICWKQSMMGNGLLSRPFKSSQSFTILWAIQRVKLLPLLWMRPIAAKPARVQWSWKWLWQTLLTLWQSMPNWRGKRKRYWTLPMTNSWKNWLLPGSTAILAFMPLRPLPRTRH